VRRPGTVHDIRVSVEILRRRMQHDVETDFRWSLQALFYTQYAPSKALGAGDSLLDIGSLTVTAVPSPH